MLGGGLAFLVAGRPRPPLWLASSHDFRDSHLFSRAAGGDARATKRAHLPSPAGRPLPWPSKNICLDNICHDIYHGGHETQEDRAAGGKGRGLPTAIFFIAGAATAVDRRLAPYGLTCQQASLLIRCVHDQGASLQQLMPHLGTDNAGVSRLVDRLEAAALVQRTRGPDRRALALQATEAGIALAPRLEEVLVGLHRELVAGCRAWRWRPRELLGELLARARALNGAEQPLQPEGACVR